MSSKKWEKDMHVPGIDEKRKHVRHFLDIPIQIKMDDVVTSDQDYLVDIGAGGLSFKSKVGLEKGKKILIKIPLIKPVFEAEGEVLWSKKKDGWYAVGLRFTQAIDIFRIRMVEQVCHIEQYKNEILEKEGRPLTGTEAALEWIQKYAAEFPKDYEIKKPK